MPLYLDTEYNGYKGALISLALFNTKDETDNFYEVLKPQYYCYSKNEHGTGIHEFVAKNVLPYLNKIPIDAWDFSEKLLTYLDKYKDEVVMADWPEDFIHLLNLLYGAGGVKMAQQLKMELVTVPDIIAPIVPHNALSDAEALCKNHRYKLEGMRG